MIPTSSFRRNYGKSELRLARTLLSTLNLHEECGLARLALVFPGGSSHLKSRHITSRQNIGTDYGLTTFTRN